MGLANPQQRVEWLRQGLWPAGQLAAALPAAASTRPTATAPSTIGPALPEAGKGRRAVSGYQRESGHGEELWKKWDEALDTG